MRSPRHSSKSWALETLTSWSPRRSSNFETCWINMKNIGHLASNFVARRLTPWIFKSPSPDEATALSWSYLEAIGYPPQEIVCAFWPRTLEHLSLFGISLDWPVLLDTSEELQGVAQSRRSLRLTNAGSSCSGLHTPSLTAEAIVASGEPLSSHELLKQRHSNNNELPA